METHVNSNRARKIIERINLSNFFKILPEGFSGWIWLLRKNSTGFHIDVLKTHTRFIHCQIREREKRYSFDGTYGYHRHHYRITFGRNFSSLSSSGIDPWRIIGDLNELSSSQDKVTNHKDVVFDRLDKAVTNLQWLNLFRDARVENLPTVGSDNGSILLLRE